MSGDFFDDSVFDQFAPLDATGLTLDDLSSGGVATKEGWAHVAIDSKKVKCEPGKVAHIVYDLLILLHCSLDGKTVNDDQKGKKVYHRLNLQKNVYADADKKQVLRIDPLEPGDSQIKGAATFVVGAGAPAEKFTGTMIDPRSLFHALPKGHQFFVKLAKEDGRNAAQVTYNTAYQLTDEEVKDLPKDPDGLEIFMAAHKQAGGTGQVNQPAVQQGGGQQQRQQQSTAAAAGGNSAVDSILDQI